MSNAETSKAETSSEVPEEDTQDVDLYALLEVMIGGEEDEREAAAFAVAEFVAASDTHQVGEILMVSKSQSTL